LSWRRRAGRPKPGHNSYKPKPTSRHRPPGPAPKREKGARRATRTPQGPPHGVERGGQARRGDTPARRTCPTQRRGSTAAGGTPRYAGKTPKGTPDATWGGASLGPPLRRAGCATPQDAGAGPRRSPTRRCRLGRWRGAPPLPRSRRIGGRGAGATGCRGGGLVGGAVPSGCPTHETSRPNYAPTRGGARAPDTPHGG
jgi:hypothetical protein